MEEIYDIYNVEVTAINKNGKEETFIQKVKAQNDLHAIDIVYDMYKDIKDIKII